MRRKPKKKAKGKKLYRNTHGICYRVKRNYKIRHKNKQRKITSTLTA